MRRRITRLGLILFVFLFLLLLWWPFTPQLAADPQPVAGYAEALVRIEAMQATEREEINPRCRTELMTHGGETARVIVLFHGYTTCPAQFHELGMRFHELGYNVFIPRLPQHGFQDRLTSAPAQLTAEALVEYADNMTDMAQGLGQEVTVMGTSLGGTLTSWVAQHRADVAQAVPISPLFGPSAVPNTFVSPLTNLLRWWPDNYMWWNTGLKAEIEAPDYIYPGRSSRGLGEILRLGLSVRRAASRNPMAAQSVVVITNPADGVVNNQLTEELVGEWRAQGAIGVQTYEFRADLSLRHDFIDPNQTEPQVDYVYPVLIELIDR